MPEGELIDGRAIAARLLAELAQRVAVLKRRGVQPGLAFVRVGEDPASKVYVGRKEKSCAELGLFSETHVLKEETSQAELLALIQRLNADRRVHGILVQAPLPHQIDEAAVYSSVLPMKDVDGFNPVNMGKLLLGDGSGFLPCTPAGIMELLARSDVNTAGAEVVILGRGNIVGKPMAALLCQKAKNANATVTICHSATRDVAAHCRRADILVAAMGAPEYVKAGMVKSGAVVIDVGVNRVTDPSARGGSRLVGDVAFESCPSNHLENYAESRRGRPDDHSDAHEQHRSSRRILHELKLFYDPHPNFARFAVLAFVRGNPPGSHWEFFPHRCDKLPASAAGAGGGAQAQPVQSLDGRYRPIYRDGAARRPGPNHFIAKGRGKVFLAGRGAPRHQRHAFGQVEFKTAGTYYVEVLVDDVMKLRYPVPVVINPQPGQPGQPGQATHPPTAPTT